MQFERFQSLNHGTVAWFVHLPYIIYDFSQFSQIWGNICGGDNVSVQPYAHPQQMKVLKHLTYEL